MSHRLLVVDWIVVMAWIGLEDIMTNSADAHLDFGTDYAELDAT